jgi:hypothetical protein
MYTVCPYLFALHSLRFPHDLQFQVIDISVSFQYRDVATSGVSTVEELCEAYGSTRSVEEKNKDDRIEQDMVPSFAETYEVLEKVKAFFYAHSIYDADRENILSLEKSYFQLGIIVPRSERQCTT